MRLGGGAVAARAWCRRLSRGAPRGRVADRGRRPFTPQRIGRRGARRLRCQLLDQPGERGRLLGGDHVRGLLDQLEARTGHLLRPVPHRLRLDRGVLLAGHGDHRGDDLPQSPGEVERGDRTAHLGVAVAVGGLQRVQQTRGDPGAGGGVALDEVLGEPALRTADDLRGSSRGLHQRGALAPLLGIAQLRCGGGDDGASDALRRIDQQLQPHGPAHGAARIPERGFGRELLDRIHGGQDALGELLDREVLGAGRCAPVARQLPADDAEAPFQLADDPAPQRDESRAQRRAEQQHRPLLVLRRSGRAQLHEADARNAHESSPVLAPPPGSASRSSWRARARSISRSAAPR